MNSVKAAQSLQGLSKGKFTLFCCGNTQCRYSAIHLALQHTNAMHPLYQALHSLHSLSALPHINQDVTKFIQVWDIIWEQLEKPPPPSS